MTRTLFADGWTVRALPGGEQTAISLPHDAMIGETRSPAAPSGFHGAFFPGGRYLYEKTWDASEPLGDHVSLFFEGVYGFATVRLNGHEIGQSVSPYREFRVGLDDALLRGVRNLLEVEVDNSDLPNSRWYTGSGIYRPVWLETSPDTRIAPDGVRVHVRSVGNPAVIEVDVELENPDVRPVQIRAALSYDQEEVAEATSDGTHLELTVPDPQLWSAEHPHLYTVDVTLLGGEDILDAAQTRVGLRTLELNAARGLRVNGEEVLLRGAAIHHDSGVLGAATFRAAEYRRARILKENGFNAIRSAHNPLSRDLLDACDEVGLYVVDELADYWHDSKSVHDLAGWFDELWLDDVRSLVRKDRNHPSVIMYSLGNEIGETATPAGVETAQRLHTAFRTLDPHRPTTLAVSFLVNVMVSLGKPFAANKANEQPTRAIKKPSKLSSTFANTIANKFGGIMLLVSRLPKADKVSRDAFGTVDAAGYNYGWSRYRGDVTRHPERVIYGSESIPGEIAKIWPLVEKYPSIIGDFMWTGWDYLGEAGLGTWQYGQSARRMSYPLLTGGCGAIDIIGTPGAPALLAQAAWGQLSSPRIAVRPLNHAGEPVQKSAWRTTDAVESWAWQGAEGAKAEIEVYSDDDYVELVLNGRSLGRKRSGRRVGYITRFKAAYEPGELVAIGYRNRQETARFALRSAQQPTLVVRAETATIAADGQDLAFVRIEVADESGTVEMLADDLVTVEVFGPGTLVGFGSGAPSSTETFTDDSHTTFNGRALAVIRGTEDAGEITVRATSERHGVTETVITAVPEPALSSATARA